MGHGTDYRFQPMSMAGIQLDMMQPGMQAAPGTAVGGIPGKQMVQQMPSYGRVAFPGSEPSAQVMPPSHGEVTFPGVEPAMTMHRSRMDGPRDILEQSMDMTLTGDENQGNMAPENMTPEESVPQQPMMPIQKTEPIAPPQNDSSEIHNLVKTSLIQLCSSSLNFKEYVHVYGELKFRVDSQESHSILLDENVAIENENPDDFTSDLALVSKRGGQVIYDDDDPAVASSRATRGGNTSKEKSLNKPFGCAICGKSFLNKSYVESHIAGHKKDDFVTKNIVYHHGEMPFKCDKCDEGFDEVKHLKKHLKSHPKPRKPKKEKRVYKDDLEGDDLLDEVNENDMQNFENDVGTDGGSGDEEDDEFRDDKSALKLWTRRSKRKTKHKKKGSSKANVVKPFGCRVCDKKFLTKQYLKKHIAKHDGIGPDNVQENILYFRGNTPFLCKVCGEGFTTQDKRKEHMRNHSEEEIRKYECQICNKRFAHPSYLKDHILSHDPNDFNKYKCPVCNKVYLTEQILKTHMETHGERNHVCDHCGKGFTRDIYLKIHVRQHTGERPYKCDYCGKTFVASASLSMHKRVHTGEKPYACKLCPARYRWKSSLERHIFDHTAVRPYKCKFCDRAFTTRSIMRIHLLTHGEKSHICDICGKGFVRARYLRNHRRSHTGEKPFTCLICGKSFTQDSVLRKHKWTHTGEKPYKCSICGARFGYKEALNKHTLIHTGGKPNTCKKCGKECGSQKDYRLHMRAHRENEGDEIQPVIRLYEQQPAQTQNPVQPQAAAAHILQHEPRVQPQQAHHMQQPLQLVPINAHTSHMMQPQPPRSEPQPAHHVQYAQPLAQVAHNQHVPQQLTYLGLEHIYLC